MTFKKKYHNWGDGKVSYIEWDKDISMPGLQFCHATGFNALTYKKLLEPLSDLFHIRAEDARGHGFTETSAIPKTIFDWKDLPEKMINSKEQVLIRAFTGNDGEGDELSTQVFAKVSGTSKTNDSLMLEVEDYGEKFSPVIKGDRFISQLFLPDTYHSIVMQNVTVPNYEIIVA